MTINGRRLAYEMAGEGPVLLAPAWWVSHLGLDRRNQAVARFWGAIGVGHTVVRYDRLGVGVSDRELRDEDLTVDGEVEVIGELLDELGAERVGLLGGSSGGCAAIAFAARFPERVECLLLYGSYTDGPSITAPAVREAVSVGSRRRFEPTKTNAETDTSPSRDRPLGRRRLNPAATSAPRPPRRTPTTLSGR